MNGKSETPKTIRDQLLAILKLYEDAERAGRLEEADNAKRMLDKLANKHHISVQSLLSPECDWYEFVYRTDWQYQILLCLAIKVAGKEVRVGPVPRSRIRVEIYLSQVQALDLTILYRYYKPLFEKELNLLVGAFVNKNGFAVPRDEDDETPPDLERLEKLLAIMTLLKKHPSPLSAGYLEDGS